MMGRGGFEPPTPAFSVLSSTGLSYLPGWDSEPLAQNPGFFVVLSLFVFCVSVLRNQDFQ